MKKLLFLVCVITLLLPLTGALAQNNPPAASTDAASARAKQEQLIGEVTVIDTATGQVTIKTDAGKTISIATGDATTYLRIEPGEKSLSNAAKITRTDVAVGDRVLVRSSGAIVEGQPILARQLIVVSKQALAGRDERAREDWRRRGINGRIIALNPETKEITITARGREGVETIILNAAGSVRILRYAPDSVRPEDARPISFAELKVGDQLRARGDRSADGTHFTPEEITAGSFSRAAGTITGIDAAKGEVTFKDDQAGKTYTVVVGQRTTLRRIPAEFVEKMEQRRAEQQQRRAAAGGDNNNTANAQTGERRNERAGTGGAAGANGERRQRGGGPGGGGGGGFQQMLESLPVITIADLKKGDVVMVNGTPTADATRLTAITITTGDAALMKRLQQFQGRPGGGQRNMSPGLPGEAGGGGTGNSSERERPQ